MGARDELSVSLQSLALDIGWEQKSERTLARVLHELRDGGWIDFPPPRAGRGSKYVISLAGLSRSTGETRQTLDTRDPLRDEFHLDTVEIPEAANPLSEPVAETPNLDSVEFRPPLEQNRKEKAAEQTSVEGSAAAAAAADFDPALEDLLDQLDAIGW